MALMIMAHAKDPKQEVEERIGDVSHVKLAKNQVLVGLYFRPDKTAGGVYLTDGTRGEDKYQGKCGLVLKTGPNAFVDDEKYSFEGFEAKVGDWVVFRVSDGWPFDLNTDKGHCRLLPDSDVKATVSRPDLVW